MGVEKLRYFEGLRGYYFFNIGDFWRVAKVVLF